VDYEKIFMGANPKAIEDAICKVCAILVHAGLTFRQAEAILDMAKDSLKDAKI